MSAGTSRDRKLSRSGRLAIHCVATAIILTLFLCPFVAADDSSSGDQEQFQPAPIEVPEGYTVELVAAPPLVKHPLMAGFDDRGRLFVAESGGTNLSHDELLQQKPGLVRMLEDTDGDGRFDKSTVFADQLTFPMGALWHDGAVYVAAPPNIWRLEDTDDDGVADQRRELVTGFGFTGNAADIHGCFLGPDGRIYWCDGRHGHEFRAPDGTITSQGKAARIFSCRADGSDVRVHCGGGMDNPVEIDFTPQGEMLGTVNLFYRERGDCVVHWMHGGAYPRYDQEQVVAEFQRTGDLLPEAINLGHVAVSGMTRVRGNQRDTRYEGDLFVTEFNTHKVVRVSLARQGSTFRGQKHEFLSSTSGDFHPTDVLEDADGSLLVIDTGGWFLNGCPTSQVAKPQVLGAIYRIRDTSAAVPDDPRGLKVDWEGASAADLAALFDDDRFAVRERAITTLAKRGDESLEALAYALVGGSHDAQRDAIWTLTRIGSPQAREVARRVFLLPSPELRSVGAYCVGITGDTEAAAYLRAMATVDVPFARREAATALGKLGKSDAVPSLLEALGGDCDRILEHALIYALIEIADREATVVGLHHESARVRRAALIALDQMRDGKLTREEVAPLLDTDDAALQTAALSVIGKHPEWAGEFTEFLRNVLEGKDAIGDADGGALSPERQAAVRGTLMALRGQADVEKMAAEALARDKTRPAIRQLLLEVAAASAHPSLPDAWHEPIRHCLTSADEAIARHAVAAVAAISDPQFDEPLIQLASDASRPAELRIAALAARANPDAGLDADSFMLLVAQFQSDVPMMQRLEAARAVGKARLDAEQQTAALELLATAGPLEIGPLLDAFDRPGDAKLGIALVEALDKSRGRASVPAPRLEQVFANYPDEVRSHAEPLLASLRGDTAEQAERLAEFESQIGAGNADRGRSIFSGSRATCITCHRVGGEGGSIGPDLTDVASRRSSRDLLEAIAIPSASLARGYESYVVVTSDGRVVNGLVTRETADALVIRTPQQTEVRITRKSIEELHPDSTSIMPAGLTEVLTADELSDLLAYLQSLKAP